MKKNCFRGDMWFVSRVAERTKAAMVKLNEEFEREHRDDTPEKLIEYIKDCAARLKHTPHKVEVIGAEYISGRFGGWGKVIVAAKLPPTPSTPPSPERCAIYKEEFKRQAQLFRQERKAVADAKKQGEKQ